MPAPLSVSLCATLRSDPTAASAALVVIANAHAELFAWAARTVCDAAPAHSPRVEPARRKETAPKPHRRRLRAAPRKDQSPSGIKPSNSVDAHLARRKARDRDDENLLAAMRETPDGPIGGWAEAIGKSRTSVVSALHRLRDAGLADSSEGKWRATEAPAPREPAPKWVAPLSVATPAHASS